MNLNPMNLNPMKDKKMPEFNLYKLFSSREENVRERRQVIKSFKAKANAKRSTADKFADWLTGKFGSVIFLGLNFLWFSIWIIINTGMTSIEPFDPYPFSFLTMVVSLEAIFLAIIVLVSQNRESKVAELREEIELQINTVAEEELTKLISLMVLLLEKQGVKVEDDPELVQMLKPTNTAKLEKDIEKELD